jgi:hypothetical protein
MEGLPTNRTERKNNPLRHSGLYSGPTNVEFVGDLYAAE